MTRLLFVRYNAASALVDSLELSRHAELASRRLADWTWANQHPPRADPRLLATIARSSPKEWQRLAAELAGTGWRSHRGYYVHRVVSQMLRDALAARRLASRHGAIGAAITNSQRPPRGDPAATPRPPRSHPAAIKQ